MSRISVDTAFDQAYTAHSITLYEQEIKKRLVSQLSCHIAEKLLEMSPTDGMVLTSSKMSILDSIATREKRLSFSVDTALLSGVNGPADSIRVPRKPTLSDIYLPPSPLTFQETEDMKRAQIGSQSDRARTKRATTRFAKLGLGSMKETDWFKVSAFTFAKFKNSNSNLPSSLVVACLGGSTLGNLGTDWRVLFTTGMLVFDPKFQKFATNLSPLATMGFAHAFSIADKFGEHCARIKKDNLKGHEINLNPDYNWYRELYLKGWIIV